MEEKKRTDSTRIESAEKETTGSMRIGNRLFHTSGRTYVMGILNVTPDSFSDGGRFDSVDAALKHAEQMIREGADLIDVGGESTRPGFADISEEEEIRRIFPVIQAIKREFDFPVSADTCRAAAAKAAIEAGADLINDIWGLKYDLKEKKISAKAEQRESAGYFSKSGLPGGREVFSVSERTEKEKTSGEEQNGLSPMAQVIARTKVCCCLMHNRKNAEYADLIPEMMEDLRGSLVLAKEAGISPSRILLDPGIGFAKNCEQNLLVLKNLKAFHKLGFPLLLGASRKSVIGQTLGLPVDQREEGTLAATVLAVMSGCMFVRVHSAEANVRAIRMTEAIRDAEKKSDLFLKNEWK